MTTAVAAVAAGMAIAARMVPTTTAGMAAGAPTAVAAAAGTATVAEVEEGAAITATGGMAVADGGTRTPNVTRAITQESIKSARERNNPECTMRIL